MTEDGEETYLVWSNEHVGWWKPGGWGYGRGLNQAGRFTRAQAIAICRDALPTAGRLGVISEIPVRLADLQAVLGGQIVPRAVFEPRLRGVRAVEGLGAPVHFWTKVQFRLGCVAH